ncbi:MAG: SpoVA/SpoVAEb family sporulation membrane protein [Clostridia bacterium]|nr:SpoVA/SpoVAEb family sporulation membrane protein [Clostridia bacterium]
MVPEECVTLFHRTIKLTKTNIFTIVTKFVQIILLRPILTAAEGFVLGVGAKMFTIAGPVIVYGTVASVVYGFIYWIATVI